MQKFGQVYFTIAQIIALVIPIPSWSAHGFGFSRALRKYQYEYSQVHRKTRLLFEGKDDTERDPFIDEADELLNYISQSQDESPSNDQDLTFVNATSTNNSIDHNLHIPDLNTALSNLQLAPASEIAYFYLQNKIGISEEVMWKITYEAGSILGFTVLNLEKKISLLKRLMSLSDEDVRTIITKQPSILHMSANKNISPKILFLVRSLDFSKKDLRTIVSAYPCVLCYSTRNLRAKLNFFEFDLGIDGEELRDLLVREPKLLCASVNTGLLPKLGFLHREIGIPLVELRGMIKKNPKIVLYSLEKNLQPKILFFVLHLKMDESHVMKLLKAYPFILDYNLEDHILPIVQYFFFELEFSPAEMRRIFLKYPKLVSHSLKKIKHVVGYLRYQLGMDARQVKRVLFQAPQVVSLNAALLSKVQFLQDTLGFEDEDELRRIIAGMPTILLCSVEKNLKPKAAYILKVMGNDELKLKKVILKLPTLMGYSLDKRIKPRMKQLLEYDIDPIKITIAITFTEQNFNEWLENRRHDLEKNRMPDRKSIQENKSSDRDDEQRSGRIVHWTR